MRLKIIFIVLFVFVVPAMAGFYVFHIPGKEPILDRMVADHEGSDEDQTGTLELGEPYLTHTTEYGEITLGEEEIYVNSGDTITIVGTDAWHPSM